MLYSGSTTITPKHEKRLTVRDTCSVLVSGSGHTGMKAGTSGSGLPVPSLCSPTLYREAKRLPPHEPSSHHLRLLWGVWEPIAVFTTLQGRHLLWPTAAPAWTVQRPGWKVPPTVWPECREQRGPLAPCSALALTCPAGWPWDTLDEGVKMGHLVPSLSLE